MKQQPKPNRPMTRLNPYQPNLLTGLDHLLKDALSVFDHSRIEQESHQIFSTQAGWAIRLDLPGFDKSDIKLHLEDHALHLVACQPEGVENRRPVSEHRFALGDEVSTKEIIAKLENGVLEILLPRTELPNEIHHIEIL